MRVWKEIGPFVTDAFDRRFAPLVAEVKAGNSGKAAKALVEWLYGESAAWDRLPPARKQIYLENASVLLLLPIDKTRRLTCTSLGEIKAPTMLMGGDMTPAAFRLTNEASRECLRQERAMQVIPGAGHFWCVDNPRAGIDAILGFVKQHKMR
jgi:pimeloyl-ACP methyl ester carboxylesterase